MFNRDVLVASDVDDTLCWKSPFQQLIQDHLDVKMQNIIRDSPEFHAKLAKAPYAPWVSRPIFKSILGKAISVLIPTGRPESMNYITKHWLQPIIPEFTIVNTEFTSYDAYIKKREDFIRELIGYKCHVLYIDDSKHLFDYACGCNINSIWIHDGEISDIYLPDLGPKINLYKVR